MDQSVHAQFMTSVYPMCNDKRLDSLVWSFQAACGRVSAGDLVDAAARHACSQIQPKQHLCVGSRGVVSADGAAVSLPGQTFSSAVVVKDGKAVLGCRDEHLYCIQL